MMIKGKKSKVKKIRKRNGIDNIDICILPMFTSFTLALVLKGDEEEIEGIGHRREKSGRTFTTWLTHGSMLRLLLLDDSDIIDVPLRD